MCIRETTAAWGARIALSKDQPQVADLAHPLHGLLACVDINALTATKPFLHIGTLATKNSSYHCRMTATFFGALAMAWVAVLSTGLPQWLGSYQR